MKERPILFSGPMVRAILDGRKTQTRRVIKFINRESGHINNCPYGTEGDRLWVRETWAWCEGERNVLYRADCLPYKPESQGFSKWKPSIFMPRWAARIILEITDIDAEMLTDITEKSAMAEGVKPFGGMCVDRERHIKAFELLWDSINGKRYPWISNPWVWVISFKKIDVAEEAE